LFFCGHGVAVHKPRGDKQNKRQN